MNMLTASRDTAFDRLDQVLNEARERYLHCRPKTVAMHAQALDHMPGGNTRTVLFHGPVPLRIISGDGCRVIDADDHEYINMLGEYTAGIFGHNNPEIRIAINQALDRGVGLSGHNEYEISLARLVCERFPSVDRVRFTNSGTEANLLAISIARHFTQRSKVMVFDGGYHGGLLYFRGGGMPINAPFEYVVAQYNDVETTRDLIRRHQVDLACVLVEPMQGATGCIPGDNDFLAMLREACSAAGAVLIFDEVMTSRLSPSGAQGMLDIVPDMTTLGKYIAGGMSFGAFGGNVDIMDLFDPRRADSIPHAGTFNNNSLSMAAGVTAMRDVLTESALATLNQRGNTLRGSLNQIAVDESARLQFTGSGSLMAVHATREEIRCARDLLGVDSRIIELLFLDLLEQGYYIAPRGFMALMLPLTECEYSGFEHAVATVLKNRADLFVNN